jgi:hypothetical protein
MRLKTYPAHNTFCDSRTQRRAAVFNGYFAGSSRKRSRQFSQQKPISLPSNVSVTVASIAFPVTGQVALATGVDAATDSIPFPPCVAARAAIGSADFSTGIFNGGIATATVDAD